MSPAQRRVHDQIIAGRRGRFGGPFQLLIRAPEICEYASKLGEHLRWGTSLPDRLSELAIITTARFWRAQYEWYAHAPLAEQAGVPPGLKQTRNDARYDVNINAFSSSSGAPNSAIGLTRYRFGVGERKRCGARLRDAAWWLAGGGARQPRPIARRLRRDALARSPQRAGLHGPARRA